MEKNYKFFGVSVGLSSILGILSIIHYGLFYLSRSFNPYIDFNSGFFAIWPYTYVIIGAGVGITFIIGAFNLNSKASTPHFTGFAVLMLIGYILLIANFAFYPFMEKILWEIPYWQTNLELLLYLISHGVFILAYIFILIGWSKFRKGCESQGFEDNILAFIKILQIGNIFALVTSGLFMGFWVLWYAFAYGNKILTIIILIVSFAFPISQIIGSILLGKGVGNVEFTQIDEPMIGGYTHPPNMAPEPQYQTPHEKKNLCPNCNSPVRPGTSFCPFCGNSMPR